MKLYIGKLDYKATEKDLEPFFAKYSPTGIEIIYDRASGRSKGFGFVNIPDDSLAKLAIMECNDKQIKGRSITVCIAQDKGKAKRQNRECNSDVSASGSAEGNTYISAYTFYKRRANKKEVVAFHSELLRTRYDIAFDIKWETKAATALNPCTIILDPKTKTRVPARYPETNKDSEYAGYNKRWLMVGGRLVISPFTVKSAIASGFANILGGCYRVAPYNLKPKDGGFQYHEETVPEDNKLCLDMAAKICPRCRMFGITDQSGKENIEAIGLRGRFQSAALISCTEFMEDNELKIDIPFFRKNDSKTASVDLRNWVEKDGKVCKQLFLPIQGEPRNNRTDKDGYFDQSEMKGAKYYHHGNLTMEKLLKLIDKINSKIEPNKKNSDFAYSHRLRNYAQVCQEGVSFIGTLGAKNCSDEEIAALLILLDSRIANHGFKVGLGKALGMGSIHSTINKVWLRKIDYKWDQINSVDTSQKLIDEITSHIPGFSTTLNILVDTGKKLRAINTLLGMQERTLGYPNVGNRYWDNFKSHLFPKPE